MHFCLQVEEEFRYLSWLLFSCSKGLGLGIRVGETAPRWSRVTDLVHDFLQNLLFLFLLHYFVCLLFGLAAGHFRALLFAPELINYSEKLLIDAQKFLILCLEILDLVRQAVIFLRESLLHVLFFVVLEQEILSLRLQFELQLLVFILKL